MNYKKQDLTKLEIIYSIIYSNSDSEFRLCIDEKVQFFNFSSASPYLVLHYNKNTEEITHIDSILHPVTEKMAIKTFKNRFQ